jgi:hypothetical protein
MQSLITGGVEKILFICCIFVQETKYTLNNENNENTVILENSRKIIKFGLIMMEKYMLEI